MKYPYHFLQAVKVMIPVPGAYTFRPDRPLPWLQKLCCWVLRRLGSGYLRPGSESKPVTIDLESILPAVVRVCGDFAERNGSRPGSVIIGYGTAQIAREELSRLPCSFIMRPQPFCDWEIAGVRAIITQNLAYGIIPVP